MSKGCRREAFEAVRDGRTGGVPEACVEPLLYWLCGSATGKAATASDVLGDPRAHPGRVRRVYSALEPYLFQGGELVPPVGNVAERRARFRLLSRAYHPDRYPDLADWLDPRAQSINAAYTAFRKRPREHWPSDTESENTTSQSKAKGSKGSGTARKQRGQSKPGQRSPWRNVSTAESVRSREWLLRLLAPLAGRRYLPQKILALTAFVCAVPLIGLYVERQAPSAERPAPSSELEGLSGKRGVGEEQVAGDVGAAPSPRQEKQAAPSAERRAPSSGLGALSVKRGVGKEQGARAQRQGKERPAPSAERPAGNGETSAPSAERPAPSLEKVTDAGAVPPLREGTDERGRAKDQGKERLAPSAERPAGSGEASATSARRPAHESRPEAFERSGSDGVAAAAQSGKTDGDEGGASGRSESEPGDGGGPAGMVGGKAGRESDAADPSAREAARAVLERFRDGFERGDLGAVSARVASGVRENDHRGMAWFRQTYGDLFDATRKRRLELAVDAQRVRDGLVRLTGRYEMALTYNDGRQVRGDGPITYRLRREDGGWKVAAIDYPVPEEDSP